MERPLGAITVLATGAYLLWLPFHIVPSTWGIMFYLAELGIGLLPLLFLINHWSQKHTVYTHHDAKGSVDVFITIVNEPLDLFEPVVKSASKIDYKDKKLFVLDDGPRAGVKEIAEKYGATYLSRKDGREHAKAGNLNFGLEHSSSDYVLVIDADQKITNPAILTDLIGHFDDGEDVAIVATRQKFLVPKYDFNHDVSFYEHVQTGKNDNNAAISCGSGVAYRRSALEAVGGFQIWNLVEDLYTSYVLHCNGYRTVYINRPYTEGTAPMDLAGIYKQRGTWAVDTLRMFFRDCPLFKRGLSFRQKMHYAEISLSYIISAISVPILFLFPVFSLLAGSILLVDAHTEYILYRVPTLVLLLLFYYRMSGDTFASSQFWASLFPVYIKSIFLALMPNKPTYRVTPKVGSGKRDTLLVVPHMLMVTAGIGAVLLYLQTRGADSFLILNMIWISLMVFWFYPVIYKGLLKE